jgi:radical SAM protein with 4Fe4S-binding SPASM domain
LLQRPDIEALRDAGLARLAISIDGPDAETHDVFRGVIGSFAESMRILTTARSLGLEVQVNTSLSPLNAKALDAMAEMVERVGAVLWSVFVVVPTGRAGASLLLGKFAIESLLHRLAEIAERAPFDVKTTAAPHYRRVLLERKAARGALGVLRDVDEDGVVRGMRGVNDALGFVIVSHVGEIFPSGFLPITAGNVRVDDLATVYRESPIFRSLRDADALEGKCGACPFRHVCGGSRARAYAATGNFMAEDPLCAYVPRALRVEQEEHP